MHKIPCNLNITSSVRKFPKVAKMQRLLICRPIACPLGGRSSYAECQEFDIVVPISHKQDPSVTPMFPSLSRISVPLTDFSGHSGAKETSETRCEATSVAMNASPVPAPPVKLGGKAAVSAKNNATEVTGLFRMKPDLSENI